MRWRVAPAFGHGQIALRFAYRGRIPVAVAGADALAVCSWDAGEPQIDGSAVCGRFT
ncbi:hypothetical protein DSM104329_01150 [Capillimicrobium parvum]|uniref:Uncharacterized protein n=1 Tax=Capillimicrobium parvum TaxID=2884022 RepID=A0A9E7BZW7_9ACTN|nr:hypothetical protein DSM104329_01150 [Capillimicrobium parvum]